jgi:hypothetical protein
VKKCRPLQNPIKAFSEAPGGELHDYFTQPSLLCPHGYIQLIPAIRPGEVHPLEAETDADNVIRVAGTIERTFATDFLIALQEVADDEEKLARFTEEFPEDWWTCTRDSTERM